MLLPNRHGSDNEEYRYGFQGQEMDNEVKNSTGSSINYKYRMHDPRIGRFFAVDPLAAKFPYWTPYAFSGNRVVDSREFEGLEPADAKKGAHALVIVIQGVGDDPPNGKTQAQNDPYSSIDYEGIGALQKMDYSGVQVTVFSSSRTNNTKSDVSQTIKNFKAANPKGKVIIVGHSQGADNAIEMLDEDRSLKVDLLITLDIKDASTNNVLSLDSDNIYGNVKGVINYYQEGEFIGGEDVEIQDPDKTVGVNKLSPGSNHRSIDNDLKGVIENHIRSFIGGDGVGLSINDVIINAKEQKLPTYDPKDSSSPGISSN